MKENLSQNYKIRMARDDAQWIGAPGINPLFKNKITQADYFM